MKPSLAALAASAISGVVFGIGLAISRMIDPRKIIDFLDVAAIPTGGWDPSLAFVMAGGMLVAFFGLRLDRLTARPLAAPAFAASGLTAIDRNLVAGAAIFGIGWGMAGLCPGPALADMALAPGAVVVFVAAMLGSSWATGLVLNMSADSDTNPAAAGTTCG